MNKIWDLKKAGSVIDNIHQLCGTITNAIIKFRNNDLDRLGNLYKITPILDNASQTVSYYDPTKQAQTTMTTYTGDYEILNKHIISGKSKNEGFTCSFISKSKRV